MREAITVRIKRKNRLAIIRHYFYQRTLLLLIPCFTPQVSTPQGGPHLDPGQAVSQDIGPGQQHSYFFNLDERQTAVIEIAQRGVDIVAFTFDSNGIPLERFDSRNGTEGVEYLTIKATASGTYKLNVYPYKGNDLTGNYELIYRDVHDWSDDLETQIDQLFLTITDQTPGVALAVLKEGEVVYKKAFGLANLDYNIPLTTSSVFHIVSVSKQFTTLALLLLENEGKLKMEDEVHKYIPELPDYGHPITLEQMAAHTSGIKGDATLWSTAFWPGRNINKEVLLNLVLAQKELNFKPGEEFSYSNGGYTLLAEVIERVSGQDFDKFIKARILDPLGMDQSLVLANAETVIPERVVGYLERPGGFGQANGWLEFEGSAGLHSSVDDLIKYCKNFDDPKIGSKDIFNKMDTPVWLGDDSSPGYGLGQFIRSYKGRKIIHHGGMWNGLRTIIMRVPEEELAIIMLSNYPDKFNVHFPLYSAKVLDVFLAHEEEIDNRLDEIKVVEVPKEILESFLGNYQVDERRRGRITMDYGLLQFVPSGGKPAVLVPVTENKLADIEAQTIFEFEYPNDGGSSYMIFHASDNRTMRADRYEPVKKSFESKNDFAGKYFSDELEVFITIKNIDGEWMYHHMTGDYQLTETESDIFRAQFPLQQIRIIRDADGTITGFNVTRNNQRVRDQYFRKVD